jgi:basic membrane protein A
MKKWLCAFLVVAMAFAIVLPVAAQAAKIKAAFIYIGPPGDLGYTYEHDRGRKVALAALGDKVQLDFIENVPEGPDAERVIRQYAQEGYDMIFATSFGYMDPTLNVAQEFPKVKFEHCSGYKTAPNMATYFGRIEEARYLTGLVAGKMTKANKIGYVAAFPIPECVRGINWFTLGVRAVNPKATVSVVWTNTWYDPVKEREAAVALLDSGVDIIAQHQDTTEPQKAAAERGKLSIGYDSDMGKFVGDSVLTSAIWNWGAYYTKTLQDALSGTWKSHAYWEGMKSGVVDIAPMSKKVPKDVAALVAKAKADILSGKLNVYAGPIADQSGKVVIPKGTNISDEQELNMDWFVQGVIGKVK